MSQPSKAIQDLYPEDTAHCYGCGRLNAHGHQLETRWEGDGTVARFTPEPYHTAIPGYVYGGLIASLIDCHGTGTATAAVLRAEGREAPAAGGGGAGEGGGASEDGGASEGGGAGEGGSSAEKRGSDEGEIPRFVTGRLSVDFLKPTPLGPELVVRGTVREMGERKVRVEATVSADGEVCARGEVVAVRMPESMVPTAG